MLYDFNKLNETELIIELQLNNELVLKFIYERNFPVIRKLIRNNSGTDYESEDIYQEAFIVFYNNVLKQGFKLDCKIQTYIYSVARRLWLNELKRKGNPASGLKEAGSFLQFREDEETAIDQDDDKLKAMGESLELIGEPCKTVLEEYYYKNKNMQEIAEMMNYTNKENAKNQKYKCLLRLKKIFFNIYMVK